MIAPASHASSGRFRPFGLILCLSLTLLTGCNANTAPVAADEDQARVLLDRTLVAWSKGQTIEMLKNESPSVLVDDPHWKRGDILNTFEIVGQGKPSGAEREFTVTLNLADLKGKELRQQVVYRVGTQPILTVFRALF